jgi:DNA polymerase III epsilon subunit-like protein
MGSGMSREKFRPRPPISRQRLMVRPPDDERLVFVDIELGRMKRQRPILQIAALAVSSSLVELESFEAKVRIDERKTPSGLIRHRHFDRELWQRDGRHPKVVAYDFARFLGRYATTEVAGANRRRMIVAQLVAHNAEFDGTFLREWFERLGLFLPASYRVFCTLQRAMWLFHEHRSLTPPLDFKLGTLCQYFGIPLPSHTAHDALADVRATAELYRRMTMLCAARAAQSLAPPPDRSATNGCG